MAKQTSTRASILAACLVLAERFGYRNITREAIAAASSVPPSVVSYHLGTMVELRRHVMREAVRCRSLPVIAQGLVMRDRHALKAAVELQEAAMQSFVKRGV